MEQMIQPLKPAQDKDMLRCAYAAGERDFRHWHLNGADLTGIELSGCNLSGSSLVGATLNSACLIGCDLTNADLTRARLSRADLTEADLSRAKLYEAELVGSDMRRIKARATNFTNALMLRARLNDADCLGALMSGINATAAQFEGANLECADLNGAVLMNANLSGANCSWSNLSDARLNWAILSWTLLEAADLENANLTGAVLKSSNMSFANLKDVILTGADLYFANLSGARLTPEMPTARVISSRITSQTYARSQWTRQLLRTWQQKGAIILDFEAFPKDVQAFIREGDCSLRIYFTIPVEKQERLALEIFIHHLVQADSNLLRLLSISNENNRGQIAFYAPEQAEVEHFVSAFRARAWQNDPESLEREFRESQTTHRKVDFDIIQMLEKLASNVYHIQTLVPLIEEERARHSHPHLPNAVEIQPGTSWSSVPKVQH